jgi:hypothetical protein
MNASGYTLKEAVSSRAGLLDFEAVRQAVPLAAFLQSLGLELSCERDTYRARCPLHKERRGRSLIIYPDGRWFCHGKCAATYPRGGDVVDIASLLWGMADRRDVIERLVGSRVTEKFSDDSQQQTLRRVSSLPRESKWPERDLEQIDQIVRGGFGLYDLWDTSPVRFTDDQSHAEEIIDILFPGDPLLCIGKNECRFWTKPREAWRGTLSLLPLIVANPMLNVEGRTQRGRQSQHTLDACAARIYLPIEFDFSRFENDGISTVFAPLIESWECDGITVADACAALHWHLAERLPLVLAVHSGGKSLHAWFAVFDRDEDTESWPFMRLAHQLGADHVTWCRSQFVRLPDGRRQNGVRQLIYYFDPSKAVTL